MDIANSVYIYGDIDLNNYAYLGIITATTDSNYVDIIDNGDPYPVGPTLNDMYVVTSTGTVGGQPYDKWDTITWNGATWDTNAFTEDIDLRIGRITSEVNSPPIFIGENVNCRYQELQDGIVISTKSAVTPFQDDWIRGASGDYLPLTGGEMSGNITMASTETVDGRDLSVDGSKLDGIEPLADVTDTANVTSAGALMDSEVTNLDQVKNFDSTDYAPAGYIPTKIQNGTAKVEVNADGTIDIEPTDASEIVNVSGIKMQGKSVATPNSITGVDGSKHLFIRANDSNHTGIQIFGSTDPDDGVFLYNTAENGDGSHDTTRIGAASPLLLIKDNDSSAYTCQLWMDNEGANNPWTDLSAGSAHIWMLHDDNRVSNSNEVSVYDSDALGDTTVNKRILEAKLDAHIPTKIENGTSSVETALNGDVSILPTTGSRIRVADDVVIAPVTDDGTKSILMTTGSAEVVAASSDSTLYLWDNMAFLGSSFTSRTGIMFGAAGVDLRITGSTMLIINETETILLSPDATDAFSIDNNGVYCNNTAAKYVANPSGSGGGMIINGTIFEDRLGSTVHSKSSTILDVTDTDDPTLFYTTDAITVTATQSLISGGTNVVYNIGHASTRTGTQLDVFTADITETSTAGASHTTGFNDATIPAGSWVWIDVVSVSGSVDQFHVTLEYTRD